MGTMQGSRLQRWFVRTFWATHNDSPVIHKTIQGLLESLKPDQRGLNVGCGETYFSDRVINVDRYQTSVAHCVGDALNLPFGVATFDLVFSQETVEHVRNPFRAVAEMGRVLRAGGRLYLQVPFIIGYHPGPHDYWRFSKEGIRILVEEAGLRCETVEISVGPGTGVYRILVEFFAGFGSRILPATYRLWKAVFAILFFPLKALDGWLSKGIERDRIPGGYLAIGQKQA
jgi:SAM-dependent methyltransferase